jgi:hypothetical protein
MRPGGNIPWRRYCNPLQGQKLPLSIGERSFLGMSIPLGLNGKIKEVQTDGSGRYGSRLVMETRNGGGLDAGPE